MRRVLETIFRRPFRLLLVLVLLPAVSVALAYALPHSSTASANLWALLPYQAPNANDSGSPTTPAQTQATALSELLQTRTFALRVANTASLNGMLPPNQRNTPAGQDALFTEVSHHVQVTSEGNNLFTITYTNQDAQLAKWVVGAVITEYGVFLSDTGVAADTLFEVIDAPATSTPAISGLLLYLLAGAIGLAIALLACTLYLLLLVRRDRTIYTASGLQQVTLLPVAMQLPHVSPKVMDLLLNESLDHHDQPRSLVSPPTRRAD
jgi:hypothetical protein